jgi:O-antigen/teichoic acid export membrane protein
MKSRSPFLVLIVISAISFLGIIAAFLFQIMTARTLGPTEFSLFAAFLAIVNIGAIGSSALQNAVTVQTARAIESGGAVEKKSKIDPTIIEAASLGFVFFLAISVFSSSLANALRAPIWAVLLAATSLFMSFILARNLGIIQGNGRALSTVSWTSGHAIIRLLLGSSVFLVAFGFGGFVAVVMASLLIITTVVAVSLKGIPERPNHAPFDRATIAVLLSTVAFAWLTNVDVIFLRALASPVDSGNYAVVALLVKTGFIVPGTLSIYFLPKLVNRNTNSTGLAIPLAITTLGILVLTGFLWFYGPTVVYVFFGSSYEVTSEFLLMICASLAPWVILQTILIRTNGLATMIAPIFLIAAALIQWPLFYLTLPSIELMSLANGLIGSFTCVILWAALLIKNRKSTTQEYNAIGNPIN